MVFISNRKLIYVILFSFFIIVSSFIYYSASRLVIHIMQNDTVDKTTSGYQSIKALTSFLNMPIEKRQNVESFFEKYFTDDWAKNEKNMEELKKFTQDINKLEIDDYKARQINTNCFNWSLKYKVSKKYETENKEEIHSADIEVIKLGDIYKINKIKFDESCD